ncbi:cytochrome c oxidase assembly protein [Exiguobacterium antarcticum]|uniref:Cytochrome c oxidase assembly protein n=1 Tax=Exiguobacterium antarcticum TaxID=132920 RepID=A0ABT6R2K1_9BACL|nr:cytochrome c oxidase assembly protein [Exiguobacterium antarcticum]AFS70406.1 hypothetical protein Eab7_1275 [Exiguobacterium antarcticum B7]MDI3235172.1 cytochrome c oxidase assembly protein [Exiguobacterium antarcticum]
MTLNHSHTQMSGNSMEGIMMLFVLFLFVLYPLAAHWTSRRYQKWPMYRAVFWISGIFVGAVAVVGPLAEFAHHSFPGHMLGHLLLGMLAPLLLVCAKPMTLLLRTLSVPVARRVTRFLNSRPLRLLTNPATAALLNIGGLYLLYMTPLYPMMHDSLALYVLIHLHVFGAGYLFTISMIYMDVTPHRFSYWYRAIVLVLALAGHKVLSKYIYAYPPGGVIRSEAEAGARLMYYGGDLVDLVLIIILCYHWYRATAPRSHLKKSQPI